MRCATPCTFWGRAMLKYADIPPVWLLVFLGLAWVIGGSSDHVPGWGTAELLPTLGAVCVVSGLVLIAAAAREFRRARTTIIPHQTPERLITGGIFAWTRNPIYLGDALILTGAILYWAALPALVLVPAFVLWIDRHFIRAEEKRLRRAFGAQFDAYAQKVRRWL